MTLDNSSLAALINRQMGLDGPTLSIVSKNPVMADYLWNAFSDALKRARFISFLVPVEPGSNSTETGGPVRHLETA